VRESGSLDADLPEDHQLESARNRATSLEQAARPIAMTPTAVALVIFRAVQPRTGPSLNIHPARLNTDRADARKTHDDIA
jgi:hypothetical protein